MATVNLFKFHGYQFSCIEKKLYFQRYPIPIQPVNIYVDKNSFNFLFHGFILFTKLVTNNEFTVTLHIQCIRKSIDVG